MERFKMETESSETREGALERAKKTLVEKGVVSREAINAEGREKEEIFKALKDYDVHQLDFSVAETDELLAHVKADNSEGVIALEEYYKEIIQATKRWYEQK